MPPQRSCEPREPIWVVDGEECRNALRPAPPGHERDLPADARWLAHCQRDRLGHTRRST